DIFDPHARKSAAIEVERFGCADRQIDDAVAVVRAAIVNAYDNRAAIIEIGHSHVAGQRQGGVRGREAVRVIDFAVGSQPAMEIAAVPGSYALGAVAGILGRHVGAAVDHVGFADAVGAATLGHRLALFNHAGAVFLAGKWSRAMGEHGTARG